MNKLKSVVGVALTLLLLVMVGSASANVLVNPGFESPTTPSPPPEYWGAGDGWASFGGNIYTIDSSVGIPPNSGNQLLKMFGGCCSGAWQQFPCSPGETWNGGVWMRSDSADPLAGGQVAAVNIEWIQADGTTQSTIIPFISNGTFTAASPQDVWTLQTITGIAPADAAFARLVVITGDFLPGGPGGAPFYDDAFFENLGAVPVEETTWGGVKALFR
ncbi:MAG: hypothetical protein KAJ37_12395 [Candidatus Krumholzibacteria bacterium]|nr:hypothetical protein [Candidatus Krumholzibacteria bacterium]